jgi:hypothetical protein
MPAAAVAVVVMLGIPAIVHAQAGEPPVRRPEVGVAAGWLSGAGLGATDANLRTRTGDDYLLFSTESRLTATPMVEARLAYALTRRYAIEGRFGFSRPDLRTSITGDVEGAPAIEVGERIDQYTFEGALVITLPGLRAGSLIPFASGGAGYLRQLHQGLTLVEEGIVYHAGAGVTHRLFTRPQGLFEAAGFRGEARMYAFTGGIAHGSVARVHAAASGGFFVAF